MQQTASATPSRQERRVRRTRAMILAGFIQLMQQKPVKDISVRELADLVDINRSTFYLHYTDIYDLLEQTENGLMDQFLAIIDKNHTNLTLQEFSDNLEQFFAFLAENQPLCRALMSPNGDIAFVRKLEKLIAEDGVKTLRLLSDEKDLDAQDLNYVTSFFLSGCVGMIDLWLQDGCQQSAQHMAELSMKLLHAGVQGITRRQLQ